MLTHWSPSFQKLLNNLIKLVCCLLCRVYVWAINSPNGGHFEIHIPGSEYLEGIGITGQRCRKWEAEEGRRPPYEKWEGKSMFSFFQLLRFKKNISILFKIKILQVLQ